MRDLLITMVYFFNKKLTHENFMGANMTGGYVSRFEGGGEQKMKHVN